MKLKKQLTLEELRMKMQGSKDAMQFKRWQAIYLINLYNYNAGQVAELLGISDKTVYTWVKLYNDGFENLNIKSLDK